MNVKEAMTIARDPKGSHANVSVYLAERVLKDAGYKSLAALALTRITKGPAQKEEADNVKDRVARGEHLLTPEA